MQIFLRETWSRLVEEVQLSLPEGWRLATHQKTVYDALADPEVDVIFDTAMTGDGKTLAASLPLLRPQQRYNAVFVYPTNELIRDQERQSREYQRAFGTDIELQLLNGPEVARVARELELRKPDALREILYGKELILTNPDLFNLILDFAYTANHENPASIAQQFVNRYRYVVFDEFHTFDTPQVNAVLEAMLFIRACTGSGKWRQKYLFLSATPNPLMLERLRAAGFQTRIIEGEYLHSPANRSTYRKILQPVQLSVEVCDLSMGGVYRWVEANLERIRSFYKAYPHSKGAIICNSVFTAKRVHALLRSALEPDGIRVGENTGLTGRAARMESLGQDLVVATSTVDVGVDFRINFLVFESLDAGSFIQRLGRLGRHSGFSTYQAVALLPSYLYERLRNQSGLADGQEAERPLLFEAIRNQVFRQPNQFEAFIPRWGGVKVALRWFTLKRDQDLRQRYRLEADRVYTLKGYHQAIALGLRGRPALLGELTAFRGAGRMDVWVHDPFTDSVGTVDLLRLLGGTEFRLIARAQAESITRCVEQPFYPPKLGLYAQIISYLDERIPLRLHSRYALQDNLNPLHQAHEHSGFYVETSNPAVREVNDALEVLPLSTCVVDPKESVQSVRRRYSLPPFFSLHEVWDDETGTPYAVAFGQDALLLDSLLHWRKTDDFAIV